ncbi:MAG: NYN domain-containing protein [Nitrosopumilaceae archaeon]|nr:NYN domain-containing protein [Nitrosopumilaceae archaeon]
MCPANSAPNRLAMLIDGDNAEAKLLDKMLEEASKHGTVTIRRIYGNWTDKGMFRWREAANKHAFQTPHQLNYTTGKNATDTFMVIDAMDVLHSGHVGGFCIVSSDSDFTGLAKRARESGMFVMGMGRKTTPESFRNACEIFTFVELLSDRPSVDVEGQRAERGAQDAADEPQAEPRRDPEPQLPDWKDVVFKAIEMTAQEEWARLADVGNSIRKADSSFDTRAYGRKTLLALVRTAPETFEVREEKHVDRPPVHYVRAASSGREHSGGD